MKTVLQIKDWRDGIGEKMTVCAVNGCFDVLHIGHLRMLEAAAQHGALIVGINSDESVRRLKGPTRPINNQSDRAEMLHALWFVHDVVVFDGTTADEFLAALKPDVWFKAGYTAETVNKAELAQANRIGCKVIFEPITPSYSTTSILSKI